MTTVLRRLRARAQRSETGFTLIEVIISLVLLTMITGAIAAALVTSLNTSSGSTQRAKNSNDAQIIAAFLTRDAQAAGGTDPQTGLADPTLGVSTTDTASCNIGSDTLLMRFKWIDRSASTDTPNVANYSYDAGSKKISRTLCVNGVSSGPQTLANNVVSTGSPQSPFGWCNGNESVACPANGFPDTVSLRFTESNTPVNAARPSTYVLTASLRPQSNSAPDLSASAATASLLLLGDNGDCNGTPSIYAPVGNAFSLTIYGEAAIGGCVTELKKDVNAFGSVFVSDTGGGDCHNFDTAPTPSCTIVPRKFVDPFAVKIAAGALTPPPGANCSTDTSSVVGGKWQPGTYLQDPQATGTTHPFASGVYVFCHGLSRNVDATATGGTFFYFAGGSYTCEPPPVGSSCMSNVFINPPTSGQYKGLAIWQPTGNSGDIYLSKGVVNITGTVYAPSAVVRAKGGNSDSYNFNQLIAKAIDGDPGGPTIRVGPPLHVQLTDPLPPGTIGQPYSGFQALALNGTGVYSNWSIAVSPAGLSGLSINSSGMIGGTPVGAPGTYTVTVTVHDSDGEVATSNPASITINPALTIGGSLPSPWVVNQAGYPTNPLTASGGSGSGYQWSWTGQPTGLTMANDGTISGTPNTVGTYTVVVTLTDSMGDVTTKNFTVTIIPPLTVVSITSSNQNGKPEQGDTITITFNRAISPSSVCSNWGAGANTRQATSTLVTLTRTGSGNDTLTVSDASYCTFQIFSGGSLDLGTTGYVTTSGTPPRTTVFGNPSPNCGGNRNCTAISINGANTVLTITLGDLTGGGTVGTVTTNPGITYTPDPAIGASGTANTTQKFF